LRRTAFGSVLGDVWYLRLRGFETESFEAPARKSVSHSHVLARPARDPEEIAALMLRLCDRLGRRLRQEGLVAGRLELQVRTEDAESRHQHRRQERLAATQDICALARQLWERMGEARPIRFMGIALTELSPVSVSQLELFDAGEPSSARVS